MAGKTNAPPTPMSARAAISCAEVVAKAAEAEVMPKITRPTCRARLRPKRSPSDRREEQAGEHEPVGVDDPLELGRDAPSSAQRGKGDVDDGVVDHDHEEAEAEHGQDQPSDGGGRRVRQW